MADLVIFHCQKAKFSGKYIYMYTCIVWLAGKFTFFPALQAYRDCYIISTYVARTNQYTS